MTTSSSQKAPPALGPYSQFVRVGDLIFVTGQVGLDPATEKLVEGGVEEQAAQCVRNIAAIAEEAGTSILKTVKTTVMMQDISKFSVINELYKTTFSAPYPARASFEASALPIGALVEIDAIIAI